MKISKTHKEFADDLKDQTALEYPERFLGPNWKNVLNFWIYLDTLSDEDFDIVTKRYLDLDADARVSAWDNAFKATEATICDDYVYVIWYSAGIDASVYATLELIASHKLETLNFLPLFLTP
jgi:hypothetical protein